MAHQERPRVVLSSCLGHQACRYDGGVVRDPFLQALQDYVEYVSVCPEMEIGLGSPRPAVRLVETAQAAQPRLVQPESGKDLTREMHSFSDRFLDGLSSVDGFVFKAASPTCAIKDAKLYGGWEKSPVRSRGPGLFAAKAMERFEGLAFEDEGRLKNLTIREHFLTRLFALARLRRLLEGRLTAGRLVRFHTVHKLLLLANSQKTMRELGPLVADVKKRPLADVTEDYARGFRRAFLRIPRYTSHLNVLEHGYGYVRERVSAPERRHFFDLLDRYKDKRVPLSTPLNLLRSWLLRFEVDYLLDQLYFEPFPPQLSSLQDSGRGRSMAEKR